jgi:cytochrome oxidase Cu insertion factor (SCO1/SenC/PrrC family)
MKKIIIFILIFCLIGITILLVIKTVNKINDKKQIDKYISCLPDLTIITPDLEVLKLYSLTNNKPIVLIAFNTSCDICHNEINDVIANIKRFKNVKIIMVSSEPMDSLISFQKKYELKKYANIFLGQVNDVLTEDKLGIEIIPQIFIYNSDKNLIKVFKGETKIDAILKFAD